MLHFFHLEILKCPKDTFEKQEEEIKRNDNAFELGKENPFLTTTSDTRCLSSVTRSQRIFVKSSLYIFLSGNHMSFFLLYFFFIFFT